METAEACWAKAEAAREGGRFGEAIASYCQTLALVPGFAAGHANLSLVLQLLGALPVALAPLRRAAALDPGHALIACNLGGVLLGLGAGGAEAAFRRALALDPAMVPAWLNLGAVRQASVRLAEAAAATARALSLDPRHAGAWSNLGLFRLEAGEAEGALSAFRHAVDRGRSPEAHANLIGALRLVDGIGAEDELSECRRFAALHAPPVPAAPRRDPDPERRLKVGYVGADAFRLHTAATSLLPLVEAHDPAQVEIVCYSDVPHDAADHVTQRFSRAASLVPTAGLSHRDLARRIRADGVDILVDVIGYPRGSRLLALAERPAPVQVNLLLMGSFGLDAVGFAIGDDVLTPPGMEAAFSEQLLRIDLAFVYEPLLAAPDVGERSPGPVVFGSFNQAAKLSPRCIATWARILARLPGSRLVLRARSYADAAVAGRVEKTFAAHGIASSRLELRSWAGADYLEAYRDIDIALDPFPYGGVITSCEALWMGTPVIGLEGDRVLGRYGAAFLRTLGLADLAASDTSAYVEAAVALACDPRRLAQLRASLRARMSASRLCDGKKFAREIEAAYRTMWRSAIASRNIAS